MRPALLALLPLCLAGQAPTDPAFFKREPAAVVASLRASHEKLRSRSASMMAEQARLYFLEGNAAKAEFTLNEALQVAPRSAEVHRLAALAWLTAGQPEKAFALHEKMLQVGPKSDDDISRAALDLMEAGFPEKADAMMEIAYKLDPRDWEELMRFGAAAAQGKQTALAVKWFGRMRSLNSDDVKQEVWPVAAGCLAAGQLEEGASLVDRVMTEENQWKYALAVARAAALAGRKDLVETWLARAFKADDGEPRLMVEAALLMQGKVAPYIR